MAMDNAKMNKARHNAQGIKLHEEIYSFACNFTCPVCCYSGAYALFSNPHRDAQLI